MVPSNKHIIIIPGNHDALRLVEPQPPLYKDLAAPIYELPNVISVSNPSTIQIHQHDEYRGLKVLAYHGYSYDYFVDKIEALRMAGGYDRPDKIMEFLLKRRHLAPTYSSTLAMPTIPDANLIRDRPDVIASGHIHKAAIASYRNVLMLSSSCWQAKTPFQERIGHNPDPCKIPIISLKEGKANMLEFG
jgi:DNA polymerase II small subunit